MVGQVQSGRGRSVVRQALKRGEGAGSSGTLLCQSDPGMAGADDPA
jgi:hypothetical protein